MPKVQVKVIGSDNPQFFSGETDLRGVFVAEGVQRAGHGRGPQGHHRVRLLPRDQLRRPAAGAAGTCRARPSKGQAAGEPAVPALNQALDANLKLQNESNSMRQIQRLQERYQNAPPGQPKGAAAGGFR